MDVLNDETEGKLFEQKYLKELKPVVFESWLIDKWDSRQNWRTKEKFAKINLEFLKINFGNYKIPVSNCKTRECEEWPMDYYLDYIDKLRNRKPEADEPLYYLKDWHLALESDEEPFYDWPDHFRSDWLNEYTINTGKQDYRFVYFGPAESKTGFHQDVLKSHSWSSNVCGEKLWHFWEPGTHPVELEGKGYIEDELILKKCKKLIQKDGQTVFVPSGWYHQVRNLRETISINHNWINRYSIHNSWEYLNQELGKIESELEYLRSGMSKCGGEWIQICQKILRSQTSMDFVDFLEFLEFIKKRRKEADLDLLILNPLIKSIKPIAEEIEKKIKNFDPDGFKNTN